MLTNRTILVISENQAQFSLYSSLMRDAGFCVLSSQDASHGIRMAKADSPHMIIAELAMPGVDGLELCRRVRKDKTLRSTPILIVGDLSRESSIAEDALYCGANDYFQKPFDQVALFEKTAGILGIEHNGLNTDPTDSTFRLLIENVTDIISILDADGTILFESPSVERSLGYKPNELAGGRAFDLIHPEDVGTVVDVFQKALTSLSSSKPVEYRFRHKDGSWKYIESIGKPFKDPQHGLAVVVTSRDTTERRHSIEGKEKNNNLESKDRKKVEKELRYQKHIYESLIDSIEGIVWEADANPLKFSFVSKQAERLLGYPTERWINEPDFWASCLHPEDRDYIVEFCTKATASLENHEFDYRILAKDGRTVWLHDIVTIDTSDPKNIRLRGVMVDITQNKLAEAALAEANQRAICEYVRLLERLATLGQQLGGARDLDSVFLAITDFANDSVPCSRLVISLRNDASAVRTPIYLWYNGKSSDASDLLPIAFGNGPVGNAIERGEILIVDDYLKDRGDEEPVVLASDFDLTQDPRSAMIAPLKVMGEVIGVIELFSDDLAVYTPEHATAMRMAANLTANAIENVRLIDLERIRAEQFRQSQQLESVGRLAGGIAHDFNNMLTAINGYSDLTLRKLGKEDPLAIRKNIEEIKKAGDRSAVLTQQLLAFSRRQVLKPKVIDINHTVEETGILLERLIGEDIELILALSPALGSVEADPAILTQVIMNLAVNARDAMPEGGRLTIETSNQALDGEYTARHARMKAGAYVMLAVSDTGLGMDAETLEHLFEPFFTTKAVGKGTGLGLATVYGIVKQSGGYVWVYSEEGLGTTFKIYLPRVDAVADEIYKGTNELMNLKGKETIFLVEDEEIVRKLSKQILETCGYTVVEARNGAEALELCKSSDQHFDLLLTDVVMPKMSGRQLVKHFTSLRPGVKVLYMSGYTDDSVLRNGVIAAGENFIQKPFTFNSLAGQVREMLD